MTEIKRCRSAFNLPCVAATLLLAGLGTPALAQALQPDIAQLGSGEIRIRVEPGKESFLITVGTTLPGITGIVVREAGSERDLVRVIAEGAAREVEAAAGLASRTTEANVAIDVEMVEGEYRVRVPGSLQSSTLETILVRTDGSVYRFVGKKAPTDGWFETTLKFSPPERCVDISLECSNGCETEKECCGTLVSYCIDCVECEITCPPCEILP